MEREVVKGTNLRIIDDWRMEVEVMEHVKGNQIVVAVAVCFI